MATGTTASTGVTLPGLTNQTYYRRVRSFDSLGGASSWSSTANFKIYPSCLTGWDNDNFITKAFRDGSPTDENVVCALYGDGPGDQTAYTKSWGGYDTTTCYDAGMAISHTNPLG